mmetsp:Transcript_21562/g.45000  ORF Transcript_21562/g.45000 Transcript_21562/m.45000 type:complete len:222 (-) Transcript_21562:493-1158(-)
MGQARVDRADGGGGAPGQRADQQQPAGLRLPGPSRRGHGDLRSSRGLRRELPGPGPCGERGHQRGAAEGEPKERGLGQLLGGVLRRHSRPDPWRRRGLRYYRGDRHRRRRAPYFGRDPREGARVQRGRRQIRDAPRRPRGPGGPRAGGRAQGREERAQQLHHGRGAQGGARGPAGRDCGEGARLAEGADEGQGRRGQCHRQGACQVVWRRRQGGGEDRLRR